MENKEIIIDGVNVKDCKRRIGKDNYCRYYKRPCSENNYNCVWKKYLRKEQECEVIIADAEVTHTHLEHRIEMCDLLGEKLKAKEQECEELKKKFNEAKNSKLDLKSFLVGEAVQNEYEQQLDQLKVENEELKKTIMYKCPQCGEVYLSPIGSSLYEENNQLKVEKEEIKKYLGISSKTIMERLEELQELRDNDKYKLYQAEQTLTEIKDITEKQCNICEALTPIDEYKDCKKCWQGKILQKISECEVENENQARN